MRIQTFGMFLVISLTMLSGCNSNNNRDLSVFKQQIIKVEKEFEATARTNGIAEAFYDFADKDAVIKRKNDTLIKGNENIRKYYQNIDLKDVVLSWTPDFVDVSGDGTLAYTYGKFIWISKDAEGKAVESRGVFHTVWKKQKDGTWKYVWD